MPTLPAWKMFKQVDRYAYELVDRNGQRINIRDHVQARAYTPISLHSLNVICRWIVKTQPHRSPITGKLVNWERGQPMEYEVRVALVDGSPQFLTRKP